MYINKIISNLYSIIKQGINFLFYVISNFSTLNNKTFLKLKNYYKDIKYKLNNLSETNLQLGIFHLYENNFNDAILRFKLVDKIFASGNVIANYWLGWTYIFKNNLIKSLHHLNKSSHKDAILLKNFLENRLIINHVPDSIIKESREIAAKNYINNFYNEKIHLPYLFVKSLRENITDLPETYEILEIGSNAGIIGNELKRLLPDNFTLTGFEISQNMQNLIEVFYPKKNIYNQMISTVFPSLFKEVEIVISLCGLSYEKNLEICFKNIFKLLKNNGYFALCLNTSDKTHLSLKRMEFSYNFEEITEHIKMANLHLLDFKEIVLGINNKYSILIIKKSID